MASLRSAQSFKILIKTTAAAAIVALSVVAVASPAGASGLAPVYTADNVCQELRTFQTAVDDDPLTSVSIPQGPGPILEAFVTWIGADDVTPNATTDPTKADSTLEINGVDVKGDLAPLEAGYDKRRDGDYWYAWSANIGPSGLDLLAGNVAQELTIRGWDVAHHDAHHGRNGAEITVVYDTSPCAQKVDVRALSGADWVYERWGKPASSLMTLPVGVSDTPRTETVRLSFWGVENRTDRCRASSLWAVAGDGDKPENIDLFTPSPQQPARGENNAVELVSNPFRGQNSPCELTLNPSPDIAYSDDHAYPNGAVQAPYRAEGARSLEQADGTELRSVEIDIRIPAGASWVALQLESEAELFGESGAWTSSFVSAASQPATGTGQVVDEVVIPEIFPAQVVSTGDPLARLGNFIWLDENRNGQQDPGEQGLANTTVWLRNGAGQIIAETITDGDGSYLFDNLAAGDYQVEFQVPETYLETGLYRGQDTAGDSNGASQHLQSPAPGVAGTGNLTANAAATLVVDPDTVTTVATDWIRLESGEENLTLDFGVVSKVSNPVTGAVNTPNVETPSSSATSSTRTTSPAAVLGQRTEKLALTGSPAFGLGVVGGGAVVIGSAVMFGLRRRKRADVAPV